MTRIIYLGGLGDSGADLSPHLRSRQETGTALREAGVPVTEFRAAVIVGSGSLSFEMVRYLTERLPVMICPKWVFTRVQPIAIRNVLDYLTAAIESPESSGQAHRNRRPGCSDVCGNDDGYARVRGLKRFLIAVPVLTPRLSSYWVHLITPIPANIARPLIKGLVNEVIVHDDTARRLFPKISPLDYETAVRFAFEKIKQAAVESSWTDALTSSQRGKTPVALLTSEGMIIERRQLTRGGSRGCRLSRVRPSWRRTRMALHGLDVAGAGHRRPALRWRRDATRTAPSRGCARWRCAGFLARGGRRTREKATPSGGNESSGPRLAGISGRAPVAAGNSAHPDRVFRTKRTLPGWPIGMSFTRSTA